MSFANQITIARILLIPFFVIAAVYYRPEYPAVKWIACLLFAVASISDAIDGLMARIRKEQTALGSFLDPFADKLLLLSAFLSINFSDGYAYKLSRWILIVIVSRDVLLISGLILFFISYHEIKIKPSFLGKATTVVQMVTVGALLLEFKWSNEVAFLAALLTVASGLGYIFREARRVNHVGGV